MNIIDFAKEIKNMHGNAYFVGGCVRDKIMNIVPHDYDIMICGVNDDDFKNHFPNAECTGASFPVYRMIINDTEMEIAFARKERKTSIGHSGFEIVFDPSVTLEEDLVRRDTTMNAIAKDILTGEVIDLFHGVDDIKNGIIRHVSNHFNEDSVRALRVARQASQFHFTVAPETIIRMEMCKEELLHESQERIVLELTKALGTEVPSVFFRILKQAGLLEVTFPFVFKLIGKIQSKKWHPEGDAFEHTMLVLDKVSNVSTDICIRFSALMHDVGKGETELPYKEHGEIGVNIIQSLSSAYPKKWKTMAGFVSNYHMRVIAMKRATKIVDMLVLMNHIHIDLEGFRQIVKADSNCEAWFLKDEVFNAIINTKIEIPSKLKDGKVIKQYVRNARIQRIRTM